MPTSPSCRRGSKRHSWSCRSRDVPPLRRSQDPATSTPYRCSQSLTMRFRHIASTIVARFGAGYSRRKMLLLMTLLSCLVLGHLCLLRNPRTHLSLDWWRQQKNHRSLPPLHCRKPGIGVADPPDRDLGCSGVNGTACREGWISWPVQDDQMLLSRRKWCWCWRRFYDALKQLLDASTPTSAMFPSIGIQSVQERFWQAPGDPFASGVEFSVNRPFEPLLLSPPEAGMAWVYTVDWDYPCDLGSPGWLLIWSEVWWSLKDSYDDHSDHP